MFLFSSVDRSGWYRLFFNGSKKVHTARSSFLRILGVPWCCDTEAYPISPRGWLILPWVDIWLSSYNASGSITSSPISMVFHYVKKVALIDSSRVKRRGNRSKECCVNRMTRETDVRERCTKTKRKRLKKRAGFPISRHSQLSNDSFSFPN